jgi:nitroreductase
MTLFPRPGGTLALAGTPVIRQPGSMAESKMRRTTRGQTASRKRPAAGNPRMAGHPGTQATATILEALRKRHSARVAYDAERRPSAQDIGLILEAARWAPTAHNMQNFEIVVIDDQSLLETFGSIESEVSEAFLRENYEQMSFSEEELLRKKVGVLASMFPPTWRSLAEITSGQAAADAHRSLGDTLQQAPVVLLVVYDSRLRAPASEGDVLGKISLGCVLENIWLMAEALGISCQVISAFSSEQVERHVKSLIDLPEHLRIAFACRLGYALTVTASQLRVRREVEDFTHHNRFGQKGLG